MNASGGLNLRGDPSTDNEALTVLPVDARVEILEEVQGGEYPWYRIRYLTEEGETLTGYVMAQYITPDATENQEQQ